MRKKKEKEEKEFIESIRGKAISGQEKSKFRLTSIWKKFRKRFKGKLDPITLKPVVKGFQLHHMDLNPMNYTVLKTSNFVALNGTTHDIVHYLYGYYRHDKKILTRLKKVLDKMIELNDGRDIRDYIPKKQVVKKTKSIKTKSKI